MEKFMEKELCKNIETLLNTYSLFKKGKTEQVLLNYDSFTNREKQIIGLVAHGLSNQQIADDLGISKTTVVTHLTNIYQKTYFEINPDSKDSVIQRVKLILYYLKFKGVLDPNWSIKI